jgi:hypothetical protein
VGSKAQPASQGIARESLVNQLVDTIEFDQIEFDQWVKAVKKQMVAALRRRGNC